MQINGLRYRIGHACVSLIALALLSRSAAAQTSAALLVKPWPDKNQVSDGYADAYFFAAGHDKNTDQRFQLYDFESVGRFRILPGNEISPRVGYDITILDNHVHGSRLPDQLSDSSIAFGTGIAKWGNGWVAGVTLGVGYAGSRAFAVGTGWYGKADLIVAKEINANDSLGIALDYNGNRPYLPDTPLPGVGFSHRFDPKLQIVVGAPYSSVDWKPIDHVEIEAEYELLADFRFSAKYEFIKGFSVYGSYNFIRDSFHVDGLGKDHRLLFHELRAEVGLTYSPVPQFTAKVAIGYAWDGSYSSGWDFRKSTLVEDFSDEPYIRGGFEWKF